MGDGAQVQIALRGLDGEDEPDPPGRNAAFRLQLRNRLAERDDVVRAVHHRAEQGGELRDHDRLQVAHREPPRPVDPHQGVDAAPREAAHDVGRGAPGGILGVRRHRVLEVEDQRVRADFRTLGDKPLGRRRHEELRPPDGKAHIVPSSRSRARSRPSPSLPRISSLCAPSAGAGVRIAPGVPREARDDIVHRQPADLVVGQVDEHPALARMGVFLELRGGVDGPRRHPRTVEDLHRVGEGALGDEAADDRIDLLAVGGTRLLGVVARVVAMSGRPMARKMRIAIDCIEPLIAIHSPSRVR